jgi:hypothetical protein
MSHVIDPKLFPDDLPGDHPLLCEEVLTLAQAARRLPSLRNNGKSVSPSTVFRWGTKGRNSRKGKHVYLEMWLMGGTNVTTLQALIRFFNRLNDNWEGGASILILRPTNPPVLPSHQNIDMQKQSQQAKGILVQRGFDV